MAFEGLAEKLSNSFKKLRSKGKLTEADVKEAMREVRLALLEADVNYKVAKEFTKKVTDRAVGSEVMESLTPAQMVIKIVNEELTSLMGGSEERLKMPAHPPAIIMMCGLQGAGKTTHAAKLAYQLKSQGHRPLLVAGDIYRPAAIKQLQVVGEKAGAPVFERGTQDPVLTAQEAVRHAKDYGNDYVIIDTAGRLQIDEQLMDELHRIKEAVSPTDILLVVDAMTGQEAVNVAKAFDDLLDITGVILTKLDGDTRGGAALSVKAVTGKPIKFAGTGEKIGDLEVFHPDRMASRILGMGDVLTLKDRPAADAEQDGLKRPAGAVPAGEEDGPHQGHPVQAARRGQQAGRCGYRRPHHGPQRGHHPLHDALRALPPGLPQRLPEEAHRRRLRHEGGGCKPPAEPVPPDPKADEAVWRHGQGEAPAHAQPPPVSFRILPGPAP